MNNTTHTPGPWYISKKETGLKKPYSPVKYEVYDGTDKQKICDLSRWDCKADKANARLITAAPELLKICKEIANNSECDLVNSERRIRLYSAIAKATGE